MSSGTENLTSGEYIAHHLQNLTFGQHADGTWGIAHSVLQKRPRWGSGHFMSIRLFWAIVLGLIFYVMFRNVAKKANSGVPTRFQAFIEIIFEFVDTSVRESFHGTSRLIAPLALTLFVWIFFMNSMDLIPVDWLPWVAGNMGVGYQKVVPTTDVNATLGMALDRVRADYLYSHPLQGCQRVHRRTDRQPFESKRPGYAQGHLAIRDGLQPAAGNRSPCLPSRFHSVCDCLAICMRVN